jgi:hypothetical protein
MKAASCPICSSPMIVLPGELTPGACASCREKDARLCRAPGCALVLTPREMGHGFCAGQHFETAYACQGKRGRCLNRVPASSSQRLCLDCEVEEGRRKSPYANAMDVMATRASKVTAHPGLRRLEEVARARDVPHASPGVRSFYR